MSVDHTEKDHLLADLRLHERNGPKARKREMRARADAREAKRPDGRAGV